MHLRLFVFRIVYIDDSECYRIIAIECWNIEISRSFVEQKEHLTSLHASFRCGKCAFGDDRKRIVDP